MHICPCPWAVEISKKIWNKTYFEPMTGDSVDGFSTTLHFGATAKIQFCQIFFLSKNVFISYELTKVTSINLCVNRT